MRNCSGWTDTIRGLTTCRAFKKNQMRIRIGRHIYIIAFCIYICAVAMLCFMKPDDLPKIQNTWFGLPSDKVAHFLMFFPYPILSYLAFRPERDTRMRKFITLIAILLSGAAIALCTEYIQAKTGYRAYELKDMLMDFTGIMAGGILTFLAIIRPYRYNREDME